MTSTLLTLLSLMLVGLGAASFISNVCNCHCGSQTVPEPEQNTDNKNCVSNETLQASLEKFKKDLTQIISGSKETTEGKTPVFVWD